MKWLEQLLDKSRVELPDWPSTEEELDEFLIDVEECELGVENRESRLSTVMSFIDRQEAVTIGTKSHSRQGLLFAIDGENPSSDASDVPRAYVDYSDVVRDAYMEVFGGYSTDRVIADPDRNCLFIQACWKRGVQASQAELNRQLMNARKAKKIGKIDGVQRYVVPRDVMDKYLFASEVSLRILQDIEHYANSRWVSLDDILCDPGLGKKFVEIASSITPSYKPVDYRWAALSIRKSFNRSGAKTFEGDMPSFKLLGSRADIRPSRLPREAGFFWLKSGGLDFYIGHSQSLKEQIEMLVDTSFEEQLANYQSQTLFIPEPVSFAIARLPGLSPSARDPLKRELVELLEPRMNVTKQVPRAVA